MVCMCFSLLVHVLIAGKLLHDRRCLPWRMEQPFRLKRMAWQTLAASCF